MFRWFLISSWFAGWLLAGLGCFMLAPEFLLLYLGGTAMYISTNLGRHYL